MSDNIIAAIITGIFGVIITILTSVLSGRGNSVPTPSNGNTSKPTHFNIPIPLYMFGALLFILGAVCGYFVYQRITATNVVLTNLTFDDFRGWTIEQWDSQKNIVATAQPIPSTEHTTAGRGVLKAELSLQVAGNNGFFLSWDASPEHLLKTDEVKGIVYWSTATNDTMLALGYLALCFKVDGSDSWGCKEIPDHSPNAWIPFDISLKDPSIVTDQKDFDYSQHKLMAFYIQGTLNESQVIQNQKITLYLDDIQIYQKEN